jgi:hypothetical protein
MSKGEYFKTEMITTWPPTAAREKPDHEKEIDS